MVKNGQNIYSKLLHLYKNIAVLRVKMNCF